jgi:hypothetical protein
MRDSIGNFNLVANAKQRKDPTTLAPARCFMLLAIQ